MSRFKWEDYDHSDQETFIYDQSCDNCCNMHCPMMLPETAREHMDEYGTLSDFDEEEAEARTEEVMELRETDAIMRDEEPTWCIYWQGQHGRAYG